MKSTSRMTKGMLTILLGLTVVVFASDTFAQGTWTTKAPMLTPLDGAVAGVINGQLYVMGGNACATRADCPFFPPPTAYEAYNPATDTWATKASAPTPRAGAGGDVINNKLYVVGGCINTDCASTTNILEVYDPASDTWASLAPMPTARSDMFVGAINGKLYVAGGTLRFFNAFTTLEVYDPSTNTWDTTKRPLPVGQAQGAAAVVNGNLYVIGGFDATVFTGGPLQAGTVQAYDPVSDTWSTKATMPTARRSAAAGVVNGLVTVVGGSSAAGILSTNEAYDPLTNTWTTQAAMPTARDFLAAGVINGVLYAAGGGNGTGFSLATNEAFTPIVPFAAFTAKVEITLGPLANDDAFEVEATFTLGTGSNGIAPLTEDVKLQLAGGTGSFSRTIPAGSFTFVPAKPNKPAHFKFEGVIGGVSLQAKITLLGADTFKFKAEGRGADLTGTVNPVTLGLTIGNDGGSTTATAEFE